VTDITTAMARLGAPDRRMADAVRARMELDLRLGSAFTRLQTLSLASRFNELAGRMVSYGPCQFPTLGFVVERYLAITAFVPRRFWVINMSILVPPEGGAAAAAAGGGGADEGDAAAGDASAGGEDDEGEGEDGVAGAGGDDAAGGGGASGSGSVSTRGRVRYSRGGGRGGGGGGVGAHGSAARHRGGGAGGGGGPGGRGGAGGGGQTVHFAWGRERVFDQLAAVVLYEACVEAGQAVVTEVSGHEAQRYKPLPMNSVDFAMLAARSLRMDSQAAAKVAEELYQQVRVSTRWSATAFAKADVGARTSSPSGTGGPSLCPQPLLCARRAHAGA
jgi:DNA topoisomerase-3